MVSAFGWWYFQHQSSSLGMIFGLSYFAARLRMCIVVVKDLRISAMVIIDESLATSHWQLQVDRPLQQVPRTGQLSRDKYKDLFATRYAPCQALQPNESNLGESASGGLDPGNSIALWIAPAQGIDRGMKKSICALQ